MNNLVSVIIPCYNAEKWLAEAIDSCLKQTYPNIEIIVVDDGSIDSSPEIATSYVPKIIFAETVHQGGSTARNYGMQLSQGEYIQFLDADDYLLPEKIKRQVAFLEETGTDVVYGDWRHLFHDNEGKVTLGPVQTSGKQDDVLEALLSGWWTANMTLLLKRDVVLQSGGWDPLIQVGQDRDFFISVAMTGANIWYQSGCHSIYRRYGDVTISTSNRLRWLQSHEAVLQKTEGRLKEHNMWYSAYQQALAKSYHSLAHICYNIDPLYAKKLSEKTFQLNSNFKPNRSYLYNLFFKYCGANYAEHIALIKRRLYNLRLNFYK